MLHVSPMLGSAINLQLSVVNRTEAEEREESEQGSENSFFHHKGVLMHPRKTNVTFKWNPTTQTCQHPLVKVKSTLLVDPAGQKPNTIKPDLVK